MEPDQNCVTLSDGTVLGYKALVLAPGLELNWAGIEGLTESLGENGVTSIIRRVWPNTPGKWFSG